VRKQIRGPRTEWVSSCKRKERETLEFVEEEKDC
jgi:hypothetical protein